MTALETMRHELRKAQAKASLCTTEHGHVITARRYEYMDLIREAEVLRSAIEQWERLFNN